MGLESILDDVLAHGKGYTVIAGSFRPNGASAVDNSLNDGTGFSVARFDVGEFRITMDETWPAYVVGPICQVEIAGVTDSSFEITAKAIAQSDDPHTFDIIHLAAGVGAEIADAATSRIHFLIVARKTDVLT